MNIKLDETLASATVFSAIARMTAFGLLGGGKEVHFFAWLTVCQVCWILKLSLSLTLVTEFYLP